MSKTRTTGPASWADAKTAAELRAVLAGIDAEISAAESVVRRLEGERTGVVLGGGSVADHSRQLFEASERAKAFAAGRADIERRLREATRDEHEATFQEWARLIREEKAPAQKERYRKLHGALLAIIEAVGDVRRGETEINNAQFPMKTEDRKDLLYSVQLARAEVAQEIGRPALPSTAVGILKEADVFEILARQVIELLNLDLVNYGSSIRAARNSAMFNVETDKDKSGVMTLRRVPSALPPEAA